MPKRLRVMHGDADWSAEAAGRRITLDNGGGQFEISLTGDPGHFQAIGPDGSVDGVAAAGGDTVWVGIGGHVFNFRVGHASSLSRAIARDVDALMPPMPATVTRITVAVGDQVKQGDVLIALEAMKMELPIRAPEDFTITAIHCTVGELVQPGTVLVE